MKSANAGSALLLCLIVIALVMVLATTSFKNATLLSSMAKARSEYQQQLYLLKGLMTYGITLCNHNRKLLIDWGTKSIQTMQITFDAWPSRETASMLGAYKGTLSITSDKKNLYLESHLVRDTCTCMSAHCMLSIRDPKKFPDQLLISSWSIRNGP